MAELKLGGHVIFVDPYGRDCDALVTAIWGDVNNFPSINVVTVNLVAGQTDTYGQKIFRQTSVVHEKHQSAHGNYWKLPE